MLKFLSRALAALALIGAALPASAQLLNPPTAAQLATILGYTAVQTSGAVTTGNLACFTSSSTPAVIQDCGAAPLLSSTAVTFSANGASGAPALKLSGSIFTGGGTTNTKPHLLLEPAGTTTTGWDTNGTMLGINAPSGFAGALLVGKVNGTHHFYYDANLTAFRVANAGGYGFEARYNGSKVRSTGFIGFSATDDASASADSAALMTRLSAGVINFSGAIKIANFIRTTAANTQTGATYTVVDTDNTIIANRAGTVTLTLPTASSYTGRTIRVVTIQAQTVVSASSNVVPLAGGAAGTAILEATAGKWADLESDGTNWTISGSN